MTGKDMNPAATKDAWIVEVPISKSDANLQQVLEILNNALAKLGPKTEGLELSMDDVDDLTAEWIAVKSEQSLKGIVRLFGFETESDRKCRRAHGVRQVQEVIR